MHILLLIILGVALMGAGSIGLVGLVNLSRFNSWPSKHPH
jgi:hypothetical protein